MVKSPLAIVARQNGSQVKLIPDQVEEEMSGMIGRHKLVQRPDELPVLVDVPIAEDPAHRRTDPVIDEIGRSGIGTPSCSTIAGSQQVWALRRNWASRGPRLAGCKPEGTL